MTSSDWGTYHLVPPAWSSDLDPSGEHVGAAHRYGPSQAEIAVELLRLVGQHARAAALTDLLDQAAERPDPVMRSEEIDAFRAVLAGLEQEVRTALLDPSGRVLPVAMADLRLHATCLDLSEARGEDAAFAVLEGLSRVQSLDDFLATAMHGGHWVLLA